VVFVDTNVFMYAVGRPHPLREHAQAALKEATGQLATSAEVLQELLHAYLPVGRLKDLDRALQLATDLATIWPVDAVDMRAARELVVAHPGLGARDLLHLALCQRHAATQLLSFDRALVAAFARA
jgi:predicted nucleic acid-binding protein